MNFQQVRNANGQNITMSAVATVIEGTSYIPSGTAKQNCKFTDASGERQSVTIWQGRGVPVPLEKQGQTLSINISCKTGNQGRINYGGFWNSNAQVRPLNLPPQQGQQAPQQVAQQPNVPQVDNTDPSTMRIVRGNALNAVMSAVEIPADAVKQYLLAGTQWILTGTWAVTPSDMPNPGPATPNPAMGGENYGPAPTEDNTPF